MMSAPAVPPGLSLLRPDIYRETAYLCAAISPYPLKREKQYAIDNTQQAGLFAYCCSWL
jgi:hypothetical protein